MLYAPKLSTCFEAQEIEETGNEEDEHHSCEADEHFSRQKLTIGLDLGDRCSWYCVLDEAGSVLLEQWLSTTPKAMREVFGGMPRGRIALETGMHSPWVSRLLSGLGHETIVAHARNVRLI